MPKMTLLDRVEKLEKTIQCLIGITNAQTGVNREQINYNRELLKAVEQLNKCIDQLQGLFPGKNIKETKA